MVYMCRRLTRLLGHSILFTLQEPVEELLVRYAEQRQCAHLRSINVDRRSDIRAGVLLFVFVGAGAGGIRRGVGGR